MCGGNKNCHACHPHIIQFRYWAWYEWLTGVILIIALIYALYGIISVSIVLVESKHDGHDVHDDQLVSASLSLSLMYILLCTHILLFLTITLCLLWLKYLRNMCIFLLAFVLLIIVVIWYFMIGGQIIYLMGNDDNMKEIIFKEVNQHMNKGTYELKFWAIQSQYQCCGVRDHRDWHFFGKNDALTTGSDSVPDSCCQKAIRQETCGAKILKSPDTSTRMQMINTNGCWEVLKKDYEKIYKYYAIECFIIAICLLGLLFLLLYICHRLYLNLVRPTWNGNEWSGEGWRNNNNNNEDDGYNNRGGEGGGGGVGRGGGGGGEVSEPRRAGRFLGTNRDREDDRDSYIVPGTPAKSLISDDERTFYAP